MVWMLFFHSLFSNKPIKWIFFSSLLVPFFIAFSGHFFLLFHSKQWVNRYLQRLCRKNILKIFSWANNTLLLKHKIVWNIISGCKLVISNCNKKLVIKVWLCNKLVLSALESFLSIPFDSSGNIFFSFLLHSCY